MFRLIRSPLRADRQKIVYEWVARCFGTEDDGPERAKRVLEEAMELAQAEGLDEAFAVKLLDRVYARPPGEPYQEAGGLGMTLLAYCAAKGFDADGAERDELARVLGMPTEHFTARGQAKADAGLEATPRPKLR